MVDQQAFRNPTFGTGLKNIAGVARCIVKQYHGCLLNRFAEFIYDLDNFRLVNVSFVQVGMHRSFEVLKSDSLNIRPARGSRARLFACRLAAIREGLQS